jgi:hypothetical protein
MLTAALNVNAQGVARLVHCQMISTGQGMYWVGTYSNGITTFTLTFPYYCPPMVNL